MTCTMLRFTDQEGCCDLCGRTLRGRQRRWCSKSCENVFWRNHYWAWARRAAMRRDRRRCVRCGVGSSLEVNHIVPRNGRGMNAGCIHHLVNLETLCHAHHLVETRRQAVERRAIA